MLPEFPGRQPQPKGLGIFFFNNFFVRREITLNINQGHPDAAFNGLKHYSKLEFLNSIYYTIGLGGY